MRYLALILALLTIKAVADDNVQPASDRFAYREIRETPDFQKHVIPLLGRLGCNSAKCHGSFQGQGGFQLSLFGFDFDADHQALVADGRIDREHADRSLVLLKPTEQTDHEGGKRFDSDSWEYHLLRRWIESGVAGETDQSLVGLRYEPEEIVFREDSQQIQVRVIAQWESGKREDVTCLSQFHSNDDAVVSVDRDGLATSIGEGDTHIVVRYDNGVAAIPVLRPVSIFARTSDVAERGKSLDTDSSESLDDFRYERVDHPIDGFVNDKLIKLGLVPSPICTDAEFLRRVSIDMTGSLPMPDEVTEFLADESDDKRNRKIDELLQRPTYAAWWSNKICDFTGCNPKSISSLLEVASEEGYVKASQWYDWTYDRVAANDPYDKLVEGIMLADLSGNGDGMPYFWTRQSLEEPKDTATAVAHAFLGMQLQCAECHKHPFDRWTQSDFNQFGKFFDSVTTTKSRSSAPVDQSLSLLGSHVVNLRAGDDPRRPIMDWMRDPKNPWFARAFVNRVWAGYFHIGIVEPPDQFTPANPPSNPQLLDWLTNGFIESGFDMKWLHREIASSMTYQRSWKPNGTNAGDRRNFSRAIPRRIPAEVVYDAMKQATAAGDEQENVRTDLRRRASGHLSMRMAGTHAMKVFGKPDRSINCDCERVNQPTLLQAIFTQNDPLVRMRIADSGWIIEIEDAEAAGERLDRGSLVDHSWIKSGCAPSVDIPAMKNTRGRYGTSRRLRQLQMVYPT